MAAMFDLNLKKKKKKKPKKDSAGEDGDEQAGTTTGNDTEGKKSDSSLAPETIVATVSIYDLDPPTYTYTQLLNRVVDFVHQNNPELTDKKRFTMKPPQLMRGL